VSTELLSVEGLKCARGGRTLLEQTSFVVRPGEMFGLLGPNGAGKSTVFRVLLGLWNADDGQVYFQGKKLPPPYAELRAHLGVVFQRSTLDELLTARENLLVSGRLYGMGGPRLKERVAELLQIVGLADRANERVAIWSGGMRRRLELIRALLHRPKLLVMDEPTAGLDEAAFRMFWEQVGALRIQEGLSVLVSTHRPDEAQKCDRLLVLNEGKQVATETPAVLARYVGGDVVTLEVDSPELSAAILRSALKVDARVVNQTVRIETPEGHALIPRLVEALDTGAVKGVTLRPPSLADVFFHLTGKTLGARGETTVVVRPGKGPR
jgi:ABC-2 type transport system ATP-binding protein